MPHTPTKLIEDGGGSDLLGLPGASEVSLCGGDAPPLLSLKGNAKASVVLDKGLGSLLQHLKEPL